MSLAGLPELKYKGLRLSNSDISIIELKKGKRKRYEVTRRMPEMKVYSRTIIIEQ